MHRIRGGKPHHRRRRQEKLPARDRVMIIWANFVRLSRLKCLTICRPSRKCMPNLGEAHSTSAVCIWLELVALDIAKVCRYRAVQQRERCCEFSRSRLSTRYDNVHSSLRLPLSYVCKKCRSCAGKRGWKAATRFARLRFWIFILFMMKVCRGKNSTLYFFSDFCNIKVSYFADLRVSCFLQIKIHRCAVSRPLLDGISELPSHILAFSDFSLTSAFCHALMYIYRAHSDMHVKRPTTFYKRLQKKQWLQTFWKFCFWEPLFIAYWHFKKINYGSLFKIM